MRRSTLTIALAVALALVAGSCGGSSGASTGSGETRTVLVDYKHDQFSSAFVRYFPAKVTVRPGDTVTFKQTWSGEPHSVTMGTLVDHLFEIEPLVEKYNSPDEARAAGVSDAVIQDAIDTFTHIPSMTTHGTQVFQPGARPCFVDKREDVPNFGDGDDEPYHEDAVCPTPAGGQPAFTGRQAVYNSGFIPYQGAKGNTFTVPIAKDAQPGTYRFYCNYHWTPMSGTLEVVAKDKPIPSQQQVSSEARKEIAVAGKDALVAVKKAQKNDFGEAKAPVAGLSVGDPQQDQFGNPVSVDEFFPATYNAKVGKPVTWTDLGWQHTISFNVPKYFPIFSVAKSGKVTWDTRANDPVAWKVPPPSQDGPPDASPPSRHVDVGEWDGAGGFHSSGALSPGDTFTVTFTKPGTYLYACVLHPPMVGKVVVKP